MFRFWIPIFLIVLLKIVSIHGFVPPVSVVNKNFHKQNCLTILEEYQKLRKLSDLEIVSLNILLRAAAVRILCTRVHDYIFHPPNAVVVKKDPFEYFNILKWHQQNDIFEK